MKINITGEGIVECYGNRAGFVKDRTAVIDEMFKRDEVAEYLKEQHGFEVLWEKGVYDRLIKGEIQDSIMLKSCRIHQLKPEADMRIKFISYEELINKGYGEPDIANYRMLHLYYAIWMHRPCTCLCLLTELRSKSHWAVFWRLLR